MLFVLVMLSTVAEDSCDRNEELQRVIEQLRKENAELRAGIPYKATHSRKINATTTKNAQPRTEVDYLLGKKCTIENKLKHTTE